MSPSTGRALLILTAGPYRSGTNDDPLPIFLAGHLLILGEWLALPLARAARSARPAMRWWAWEASRS